MSRGGAAGLSVLGMIAGAFIGGSIAKGSLGPARTKRQLKASYAGGSIGAIVGAAAGAAYGAGLGSEEPQPQQLQSRSP